MDIQRQTSVKFEQNEIELIQGNAFENVIYRMSPILFSAQGVNSLRPSDAYMRQWTNQHWLR